MPTLDEMDWLSLPQGDRAQWAKDIRYIEVWRWRIIRARRYEVYLFHEEGLNQHVKHFRLTKAEADNIVCEYSDADPLLVYCRKLVESGEAEPLPYGLGKVFKRKG
jgi:hypothetical protein